MVLPLGTEPDPSTDDLSGLSVCVVACHYKPETTGSAPYNTMLVRTLVDAGANVTAVTGIPHYPQWKVQDERYRTGLRWREDDDGAQVTRVRHAVPARTNLVGRARLEGSFAALATPYVRASAADVLVAVTPLVAAMLAAQVGRRGRPLGVIVHDLSGSGAKQSGNAGGAAARAVGALEYRLLAHADQVGIITPRFSRTLVSNGVAPERISTLPIFTHVDSRDLGPEQARGQLGWKENGTTIVHTGNMGMKQGLEHVVDVARASDESGMDVNFVFVGDGNQRARLQELASGLPNVRFVPPVAEDVYPVVLAAADVLLLHEKPGVTEMSLPSKLTSYVTARRPILAAVEVTGITKALLDSHGAALTTPSGDVNAMLDALRRLRSDRALADALVAGAQNMGTAEFSSDQGKATFRRFVGSLAAKRADRPEA
jgi:colanic acid biosynthesis glycosyl transferase WcaI